MGTAAKAKPKTKKMSEISTLKVALFNYLPNTDRWQETVTRNFAKKCPTVKLEFVKDFDCYGADTQTLPDVFVVDGNTFATWKAKTTAFPIKEIDNLKDILTWTYAPFQKDEANLWGVPYLACTDGFFYRTADKEMATAKTMEDVVKVSKANTMYWSWGSKPGMTTVASYATLFLATAGKLIKKVPLSPKELDKTTIELMKSINTIRSAKDDFFDPKSGLRTYLGYSESSSGKDTSPDSIRLLPSAQPQAQMYVDYICLNAALEKTPRSSATPKFWLM